MNPNETNSEKEDFESVITDIDLIWSTLAQEDLLEALLYKKWKSWSFEEVKKSKKYLELHGIKNTSQSSDTLSNTESNRELCKLKIAELLEANSERSMYVEMFDVHKIADLSNQLQRWLLANAILLHQDDHSEHQIRVAHKHQISKKETNNLMKDFVELFDLAFKQLRWPYYSLRSLNADLRKSNFEIHDSDALALMVYELIKNWENVIAMRNKRRNDHPFLSPLKCIEYDQNIMNKLKESFKMYHNIVIFQ